MKIAMVTSWGVQCGIARYAEELVESLKQFPNCQVDILPAGVQVWKEQKRTLGWFQERLYWLEIAAKTKDTDLVHIQFAPHFFGGLKPFRNLLPFFLNSLTKPTVVTVHEIDLTGSPLMKFVKVWVQRRLFRAEKVSRLIALTNFAADQLKRLGYENVKVIPMWVPSLKSAIPAEEAKQRLGLIDRFVVTVFGFIVARRGYETLLDALQLLPDDTLLVFAGGPHPLDRTGYYAKLIARIAEHPNRSRIHVTGYLPDEKVDLWLAASDVVVAPFRHLSGSASLMRVLAHGKPVVASDLPPLRELAEQSGALILVPPDDFEAIAEAVKGLKNLVERVRYELSARNFASQQTAHKIAETHLELYKAILQSNFSKDVLS
ncbi:MAG: glycosyltransferase [Armatimonadetes bacterium]|nr:glycosyltransferase [Armatimonadota bacterium]